MPGAGRPWYSHLEFGVASVELTSMEIWGHMGVLPLEPDPSRVNQGAPLWQRFPGPGEPDLAVETLNPVAVFAQVRARPERPIIIINHPRGPTNYFGHVGFDPVTGAVDLPDLWDEEFQVVEVFNGSSWQQDRDGTVRDWLGLLRHGRRVFAVGSSDTHFVARHAVGYPRTCLSLDTDDPRALTGRKVADAAHAGRSTVSGGVYLTAEVAGAGPGQDATGLGATAILELTVQAPSWVDVDTVEVVVDAETLTVIAVVPADADPIDPAIRWRGAIEIPVAAAGSFVIAAAHGTERLDPVSPGRRPFGVTNPIFLER